MIGSRSTAVLGFVLLCNTALAQQGVLTNGNSALPPCALQCTNLINAAAACQGTTAEDQAIWSCFCQSGYLKQLYTTDTGVCDSVCTDSSDGQQVVTWYQSNCGSDNGLSEHPDTTPVTTTAPTASTAPTATPTSAASSSSSSTKKSWWDTHYQWVVMLLVLAIGLTGLAFLLMWFKRWRRRRQDRVTGGFNTGITTRYAPTAPPASNNAHASFVAARPPAARNLEQISPADETPVRTRDSFMPYGSGYTRSETRLGYQTDRAVSFSRQSTPAGVFEKQPITSETQAPPASQPSSRPKSAHRLLGRDRASQAVTDHDGQAGQPESFGEKST